MSGGKSIPAGNGCEADGGKAAGGGGGGGTGGTGAPAQAVIATNATIISGKAIIAFIVFLSPYFYIWEGQLSEIITTIPNRSPSQNQEKN